MLDKIFAAGVVGAGGAGFPTHVKYKTKTEVFIVNAIECEPLLRTDRYIVETFAPEIVAAALQIKEHLGASRAVIAVKEHNAGMVSALRRAVGDSGVDLYLSPSVYPAGDEQNLIFCITGRVVPTGGLPLDVGCVVSNAATVFQVHEALAGRPVTDKIITIGGAVANPMTVSAPIGTALADLLPLAGGAVGDCVTIIGGPLMGRVAESLDGEVVTKTTGGLLALPRDAAILPKKEADLAREVKMARAVCCQCSMCTQMCPRNAMGLNVQPHKVMRALAAGNCGLIGAEANGVWSCCDCGICSDYACNFGLHPSKMMQVYKGRMREQGVKPVKEVKYQPQGFENKRLPTARLMGRLDLSRYDADAPFAGSVEVQSVRIPLKMHVGGPCTPTVGVGEKVEKGQLIARPEGLGANIHASIAGTVTAVTAQMIEIRR